MLVASMTSVTNLSWERHPVKTRSMDVVRGAADSLLGGKNPIWKITLPPTWDQMCWFFFEKYRLRQLPLSQISCHQGHWAVIFRGLSQICSSINVDALSPAIILSRLNAECILFMWCCSHKRGTSNYKTTLLFSKATIAQHRRSTGAWN